MGIIPHLAARNSKALWAPIGANCFGAKLVGHGFVEISTANAGLGVI